MLTYGLVTGRFDFKHLLSWWHLQPETARILCYLCLGIWLTFLVLAVIAQRSRPNWSSCGTIFVVSSCVNVVQVLVYLTFRPYHPALLFPLIYMVPALLIVAGLGMAGRSRSNGFKPMKCAECGSVARFILASDSPSGSSTSKSYCLDHMMAELTAMLAEYCGRFVIMDRQRSLGPKSGQYCFYTPEGLAIDSYPESDVDATRALLRLALAESPELTKAVRIPGEAVKEIGKFDDTPLFNLPPGDIPRTPMSEGELIAFLHATLSEFDQQGCRFRMSKPHSAEGIYLWHDYI